MNHILSPAANTVLKNLCKTENGKMYTEALEAKSNLPLLTTCSGFTQYACFVAVCYIVPTFLNFVKQNIAVARQSPKLSWFRRRTPVLARQRAIGSTPGHPSHDRRHHGRCHMRKRGRRTRLSAWTLCGTLSSEQRYIFSRLCGPKCSPNKPL